MQWRRLTPGGYHRPMHPGLKRAVVAAALLGPLAGCLSDLQPGAKSIFDLWSPPAPEEAARWAIDPYDPENRYRGTMLLANASFAGQPVYIRLFEDNIKDADPGVRGAAIRGLANHGNPDHVPLIAERLKDTDPSVRIEAARGLQRLHNPVAVAALIEAIDPAKEDEPAVRAQAATALGQYRQPRVVEQLITSLDDENLSINHTTRSSLSTLTGQDFGFDRGSWARWNKDEKQTFAAGGVFMYPVFNRAKRWYEHIPFVPPPPNEISSIPAGMKPVGP